jgi:spore maturation protein CgeB
MRILAFQPTGIVRPSIHASMVLAFRAHGIEVLNLAVPRRADEFLKLPRVVSPGIQAVFTLDLGADPYFITALKDFQASLKLPWLVWFVDDPEGYGFPKVCHPDWTIPFCWDRDIVHEFHRDPSWRGRHLTYLPLGTDPEIFFPRLSGERLSYPDGVFVGSTVHPNALYEGVIETDPDMAGEMETLWQDYHQDFRTPLLKLAWKRLAQNLSRPIDKIQADPLCRLWVKACVYKVGIRKRREVVTRVLGSGGYVFGDGGWADIVGKKQYHGRVAYGKALRKIYQESAFVLEVRQPQALTGLTQRVFDASALGSPVLAEWSPELEDLFDPEQELYCFRNLGEAEEMKERYEMDPTGARQKGIRAMARVLAQHTYYHRAQRIIESLHQFES